jgi:hypothetical protein
LQHQMKWNNHPGHVHSLNHLQTLWECPKGEQSKSMIKVSILDSKSFKVWFQILTRWEDQREKSHLS